MSKYISGLVVILATITVFAGPTVSHLTQDSLNVESESKQQAIENERMNAFAETALGAGSNARMVAPLNRRHNNTPADLEGEIQLAGNQHTNMVPGAVASNPNGLFVNAAVIAEPGSLALIGIGMIGLALLRRHIR